MYLFYIFLYYWLLNDVFILYIIILSEIIWRIYFSFQFIIKRRVYLIYYLFIYYKMVNLFYIFLILFIII